MKTPYPLLITPRQSMYCLLLLIFSLFLSLPAGAQNYLTAEGNKLLDSQGNTVRLTGVNWFGFETNELVPHGLWARDCKSMLQQIKDQGFNCIRIPWCNAMLAPEATAKVNSFGTDPYTGVSPMNAEEATKTKPIEILDIIVDWCQNNNMKIILDNHSREPGGYMNEDLWYTSNYPESQWISDWVFIAERYQGVDAVVAMDLNNEPHDAATWGNSNPATDWNKAAERCGNAILEVNPDVLIMVEGIEDFNGDVYWWGGNLKGAIQYPIVLSNPSKLVYSPHEYGPTVFPQDWFNVPNFPANMPAIWEDHFAFIYKQDIAPMFVGEFGIRDAEGKDEIWFDSFLEYMGNDYSWTFWCWNPNSGDTGGLLDTQWANVVTWKMEKLAPYLAAEIPNGSSTPSDILSLSKENITFNTEANSTSLSITANNSWQATNDADWISLSATSGNGNSDITISSTANTTSNARSTSIVFTSGNLTETLFISQNGINDSVYLNASPKSFNLSSPEIELSASIMCNTTWSATSASEWIELDSFTGNANGTLSFTVEENNSDSSREGFIEIQAEDITVDIQIIQQGMTNEGSCSNPVEINLPFSFDGTGEYCWVTDQAIQYINSWNAESIEINEVDFTNTYGATFPDRINNHYYIHYKGNFAYSHMELNENSTSSRMSHLTDQKHGLSYPNPAKNKLLFKIQNSSEYSVIIINANGQKVINQKLNDSNSIDIDELPNGIYTIQLYEKHQLITTEKLIIK